MVFLLDRLRNRSIQRQLLVVFVGFALVTALVGAAGVVSVNRVNATTTSVVNDDLTVRDGALKIRLATRQERAALYSRLLGDVDARNDFDAGKESFEQWHSTLAARDDLTAEEEATLATIEEKHAESVELAEKAMVAKGTGNLEDMTQYLNEYDEVQEELIAATNKFEQLSDERMDSAVASAQSTQQQSMLIVGGLTLLAVIAGLLAGRRLGGSIGSEIRRVRDVADDIAGGDLESSIGDADRNDEIGDLVASFNSMQAYLTTVRDQARAVADQDFDDDVLDEDVPGTLGDAMAQMADDIAAAQRETEEARRNVESLNAALRAKADEYRATMEQAADGDLTQRMDPASESDALSQVAEAFNAMMDDLEDTITTIRGFADDVAEASEEVTAGSRESRTASEEVSTSIQEISADAESQFEDLQEVSGEMQDLSGTVEEVASSADQIAAVSQRTANLGESSQDAAADAMDEMVAIEAKSDETVAEVQDLADEIDEIGEIVELITEIAEQTNMLALNASIEAARAGEAGEGFAVVAEEIKQLAGDVSTATDEVESLIAEIQSSTDNAVADIQEMGDRVSSGTETIEDALESLEEIVANVEESNQSIQEINAATDDQARSTETVASMIDDVAAAADGVRSESQNVSAAAEEQTSSLTQVSRNTEKLADQADDLRTLLAQFTVADGAADRRTTAGGEPTSGAGLEAGSAPGSESDTGTRTGVGD